jgi:sugar phosphate isomerase/epimerase
MGALPPPHCLWGAGRLWRRLHVESLAMPLPPITVSTVAFDGHPLDVGFAALAAMGLPLVEPAYIKGYMEFDEADFSEAAARAMTARLQAHGLSALAISAHMDSGAAAATEMLARRIRFTAAIGARVTITNSTTRDTEARFRRSIAANLPLAEELGVTIALENPGNGPSNLMRDGASGAALVASFGSPHLRLNYDTANALTCTEGDVRPETDVLAALPPLCHMHLKDVLRRDGGWHYVAIGTGELDYGVILAALRPHSHIPLTLELPLRLRRQFHQDPTREAAIPDLATITAAIRTSWETVRRGLGAM